MVGRSGWRKQGFRRHAYGGEEIEGEIRPEAGPGQDRPRIRLQAFADFQGPRASEAGPQGRPGEGAQTGSGPEGVRTAEARRTGSQTGRGPEDPRAPSGFPDESSIQGGGGDGRA